MRSACVRATRAILLRRSPAHPASRHPPRSATGGHDHSGRPVPAFLVRQQLPELWLEGECAVPSCLMATSLANLPLKKNVDVLSRGSFPPAPPARPNAVNHSITIMVRVCRCRQLSSRHSSRTCTCARCRTSLPRPSSSRPSWRSTPSAYAISSTASTTF